MIEYTSPLVLEHGTDPIDPAEIDWPKRQSRALIPFEVRNGRPRVPLDLPSVIDRIEIVKGRNDLPLWGENPMANALVTATHRGVRYVLLIERGDGGGWAMPGGAIEPGESGLQVATRKLEWQTALDPRLPVWKTVIWMVDEPRWVPDPRGSMEAWAVTVVARCDLGEVDALPEVRGGDDARRARWWTVRVARTWTEKIFPAHREILGALR